MLKMNFEEFCQLVESGKLKIVVNFLLLEGPVFYFKKDHRKYFDFKSRISTKLNVHPKNIEVVGSAKLGFRLKVEKPGKPFGADSDIDVVIVSNNLFEKAWLQLISIEEKMWHELSPKERIGLRECKQDVYWGYIRPDRITNRIQFSRWWWTTFEELSNCEDYDRRKIRGRLFKSWKHVQRNYCYLVQHFMQQLKHLGQGGIK